MVTVRKSAFGTTWRIPPQSFQIGPISLGKKSDTEPAAGISELSSHRSSECERLILKLLGFPKETAGLPCLVVTEVVKALFVCFASEWLLMD